MGALKDIKIELGGIMLDVHSLEICYPVPQNCHEHFYDYEYRNPSGFVISAYGLPHNAFLECVHSEEKTNFVVLSQDSSVLHRYDVKIHMVKVSGGLDPDRFELGLHVL